MRTGKRKKVIEINEHIKRERNRERERERGRGRNNEDRIDLKEEVRVCIRVMECRPLEFLRLIEEVLRC